MDSVNTAYRSAYLMFVAGRTLGDILGEELTGLADGEEKVAEGHLKNARLLRKLRPFVRDGQRVRDCLSEKRLRAIMIELEVGAA